MATAGLPAATRVPPTDTAPLGDATLTPALAALTVVGIAAAVGLVLSAAAIATGDAEEAGRLGIGVAGVVLGAAGVSAAARLTQRLIRLRDERLRLPFRYEILRSKLAADSERGDDVAARYEEDAEALYARLMAAGMTSEAHALAQAVVRLRGSRG